MTDANLTERQRKWFASVRAGLERDTGKSLEAWVEIARTCPASGHRARLKWLKDSHGLLQNRASHVLSVAFPSAMDWEDPDRLLAALWSDPASKALFEAVDALARRPNEVVRTVRKSYAAWSRRVQFAAARPVKGGKLLLGLAVPPDASLRLEAPRSESWSERLSARTLISSAAEVDAEVEALLRAAWERS
ncbi:MAG TPA: DUF4287 domain-containing protein [Caulobacteraceae bacterium]|jgi:hypothetical protein|nr:DUF4287 domain-containing protein [Caulobacteraceae bacterium]